MRLSERYVEHAAVGGRERGKPARARSRTSAARTNQPLSTHDPARQGDNGCVVSATTYVHSPSLRVYVGRGDSSFRCLLPRLPDQPTPFFLLVVAHAGTEAVKSPPAPGVCSLGMGWRLHLPGRRELYDPEASVRLLSVLFLDIYFFSARCSSRYTQQVEPGGKQTSRPAASLTLLGAARERTKRLGFVVLLFPWLPERTPVAARPSRSKQTTHSGV